MTEVQTGILAALPALGRYLNFGARPQGEHRAARRSLSALADGQHWVVGLGESLVRTAQESFESEAFMLRRSMPWAEELRCGLMMRDGRLDLRALGL